MCTKVCPCKQGNGNSNTKLWDGYGVAFLNEHNRTTSKGIESTYVSQLYFNSGTESVSNYKACYDNIMKAEYKKKQATAEKEQIIKDFFDKGGYEFLSQLEGEY